jgi:hypothetical protein
MTTRQKDNRVNERLTKCQAAEQESHTQIKDRRFESMAKEIVYSVTTERGLTYGVVTAQTAPRRAEKLISAAMDEIVACAETYTAACSKNPAVLDKAFEACRQALELLARE